MSLKSIGGYYASQIFINAFSSILTGKDYGLINEGVRNYMALEGENVFAFVSPIVSYLKTKGFDIILFSNEPQFVSENVAKLVGFDVYISSVFEVENNIFTGKIKAAISTAKQKRDVIKRLLNKYPFSKSILITKEIEDLKNIVEIESKILFTSNLEDIEFDKILQNKCHFVATNENIGERVVELISNQRIQLSFDQNSLLKRHDP